MEPISQTGQNKKTILIIEDEPSLVEAYKIKFEDAGFTVWLATDGEQGMLSLQGEVPDAVLLDLALPWVSGLDILSAIKKLEAWKNVPILVLTNLSSEKDVSQVKALGVRDYIIKANVNLNDILVKVREAINV